MMEKLCALMMMLLATVQADTASVKTIYDANTYIGEWINPNAVVGITLTIIFFWVCSCVLSATAQIQTPRIMLEKCIDWGKVEKVDE